LEEIRFHFVEGPELAFVVDLGKKTLVFLGIFAVGFTLNAAGAFLEARHEHWSLVYGAYSAAHLVTACDILGFGVYVVLYTSQFVLKMFFDAGIDIIGLGRRAWKRWKGAVRSAPQNAGAPTRSRINRDVARDGSLAPPV
jgi:hypothetical protein